MRLVFLVAMLLLTVVGIAQKRILVTDKVDVKDSIRLRGKSVAEFSRDSQFLAPTHYRVPTQKAVRDYVSEQLGNVDVDSLVKAATASGFLIPNSLPYVDANGRVDARGFVEFGALGSAPSAPSAGFRFFGDASGRPSWRRADGFVRTFDAASITGDRVYTLQDATGTLAMLGVAQTWTGVQTFAPSGSGGSGFTVQGTARFSMPIPVATDAQIAALTGNVLGAWMVSNTQSMPYFYNGSAYLGVMLGPQGGIGAGVIPQGATGGKLVSDANFKFQYNGSDPEFVMLGRVVARISNSNGELTLGPSASTNNVRFTKDARFEGFVDNVSAPLQLRGSGGVKLVSVSGGDMMYVYTDGITINYNAPPPPTQNGFLFRNATETYTNTTTASGGTVPAVSVFSFVSGSIVSSNTGVNYTNAATVHISGSPTAGTNSNIVSAWSLRVDAGNSYFGGQVYGSNFFLKTTGLGYYGTDANIGMYLGSADVTFRTFNGNFLFNRVGTSQITAVVNTGSTRINGNVGAESVSGTEAFDWRFSTQAIQSGGSDGNNLVIRGGNSTTAQAGIPVVAGDVIIRGGVQSGSTLGSSWDLGQIIFQTAPNVSGGAATERMRITNNGSIGMGTATPDAAALLELASTTSGFLGPRATDAQISAISSKPVNFRMFSLTKERQVIKRTDGEYLEAFLQDIKRDTSYKVVNANLDLSGQTAFFKNNYHTVRITTIVTAAASGNNTIIMPVPGVDLLGINFKISVEDTSGDSDVSVLSFGTDGTDGYLYNGDGTYASSQNLFPGLGVYLSVAWCEAKGAYRWLLQ